jgi:hypothetical protein
MPVLFLRVSEEIHWFLKAESKRSGKTVNWLANRMIERAIDQPPPIVHEKPKEKRSRKRKSNGDA